MLRARLPAVAATALLLVAAVASGAEAASGNCADAAERHGAALAARAVEGRAAARHGRLRKAGRGRAVADRARWQRRGQIGRPARRAAPYSWFAEVAAPAAGTWHATLTLDRAAAECSPVTRDIAVSARKPEPLRTPAGSFWQVRNSWNSTTEALFSAWIEKLFDAPPDQDLNWKVWSEVLRDRSRNFLFNYLGRGEDNAQERPSPRLRRLRLLPARLFRLQDGTAVRLFELLARLRRQAAQMLPVVRHRASRSDASAAAARTGHPHRPRPPPPRRRPRRRLLGLFDRSQHAGRTPAPVRRRTPGAAEAEAPDQFRRISARRRRRRPYRRGARGRRTTTTPISTPCR